MQAFITKAMLRVMILLACLSPAPAMASSYSVGYTFTDAYGAYTYQGDNVWLGANGLRYGLREWSAQKWDAYLCKYVNVLRYEYYALPQQAPAVNEDRFMEILASNLGKQAIEAQRGDLLRQFYGASYPVANNVYGYKQRIELNGGQYSYSTEQADYLGQALLVAVTQNGLNAEKYVANAPVIQQLTADTIDKLSVVSGQAAVVREFGLALARAQQAAKPGAVIEQQGPVQPQVLPPAQMPRIDQLGKEGAMAWRQKILGKHLLNPDPALHMPKGGATINGEEIVLWMKGDFAAIDKKYSCVSCHEKQPQKVQFKFR